MSKNIIFYFSGTGNSLKVAQEIAANINDCEIVSMGSNENYTLETTYESIGFVYPTYFAGLPAKVAKFINNLNFNKNKSAYYYGIATYGGTIGNGVRLLKQQLSLKGVNLEYGKSLKMFSNYVILYKMSDKVEEKSQLANIELASIIKDIKNKHKNEVKKANRLLFLYYQKTMKHIGAKDSKFNVSNACINCEICKKVCPVENIEMINNKPAFKHHCEQCMACIQYCPKQAINYKNKTQNRGRYHNPSINHQELAKSNHRL